MFGFSCYSLALLWYHTILCPFFASSGNGEKVKKQLEVAEDLLTDSTEFRESALFLYFEGRLNRIKVCVSWSGGAACTLHILNLIILNISSVIHQRH